MLSAVIATRHRYPALPLAGQPGHERSLRPGPLVLETDIPQLSNAHDGYRPNCLTTF